MTTMKKKNIFILLGLVLSMLWGLTACSNEESDSMSSPQPVKTENGFYVYHLDFNCAIPVYDDEGVTRAVTNSWTMGTSLFARFKSGSTYYLAYVNIENDGWSLISTTDFIEMSASGTCELYYFLESNGDYYHLNMETAKLDVYNNGSYVKSTDLDWNASSISLTEGTAVYATTTATYSKEKGNGWTIKATLTPLMWRMRFSGTNGTSITMPGSDNDIKYCTAFNWSTSSASFSKNTKSVSLKVSSGYTPYIYGEFKSPSSSNKITVKNGSDTYTRSFNGSNLKAGASGYFTIPTASNYSSNGWTKGSEPEPDPGEVLFEEPYCGWVTSLSTVRTVVANMGYSMGEYSQSEYFMCNGKNKENCSFYNFRGNRLDYVDVWFNESEVSLPSVRNYMSSKLGYTYTGSNTSSDGTVYYYYTLPDKVTTAYVYRRFYDDNTASVIVIYRGINDAILFGEPYMEWGASMSTTKSAVEALGYVVDAGMTSETTLGYESKYNEWFSTYNFSSSQLSYVTVYFDKSIYSIDYLRNYLSKIWKYTYSKKTDSYYYYLSPDGKSEACVYISDGYRWVHFNKASSNARSLAPSFVEEQQIKAAAEQAAKMPKKTISRAGEDQRTFFDKVEKSLKVKLQQMK
jgi:hypothetical protein